LKDLPSISEGNSAKTCDAPYNWNSTSLLRLIHHMAVSPLANRKRLFNSKITEFRGVINYGVGNEKQVKPAYLIYKVSLAPPSSKFFMQNEA
jgi:hypothetical protein